MCAEPLLILAHYGFASQLLNAVLDLQTRLRGDAQLAVLSFCCLLCNQAISDPLSAYAGLTVAGHGLGSRSVRMIVSCQSTLSQYTFDTLDPCLSQ